MYLDLLTLSTSLLARSHVVLLIHSSSQFNTLKISSNKKPIKNTLVSSANWMKDKLGDT